jgi:heme exporter protein A
MLKVNNIEVNRGLSRLFSSVSFTLSSGEVVVVSGGNGVGKSSLLAAIVGLLSPTRGSIERQGDVFYVGHKRGLRMGLSVLENLQQDIRYRVCQKKLAQALEACGLHRLQSRFLHQLSAGQHQRVALAKLWLSEASLWVLDEPFEALDTAMRLSLEEKIQMHLKEGGGVIVATHIPLTNKINRTKEIHLGDFCAI